MKLVKSVAERLNGFDKPTVWSVMAQLAIETKAVNLVNSLLLLGARVSFLASTSILY